MNLEVKFYDEIEDENLKFAVIMARYDSKWIFCKHKERDTYEIPGGHRETGESIFDTAKRELQEETGAIDFEFEPVSVYSVTGKSRVNSKGDETFGMLFYAEVHSFKDRLEDEIEKIELFSNMPNNLTYPEIQPFLYNKVIETKINDNGLKSKRGIMRINLLTVILTLTFLLNGCNSKNNECPLEFFQIGNEKVEILNPDDIKSVVKEKIIDKGVSAFIFIDRENNELKGGINLNGKYYYVGQVSMENTPEDLIGIEEVQVFGKKAVKIYGILGANYAQVYYWFFHKKPEESIIQINGNAIEIDLDDDGKNEIVSTLGTVSEARIYILKEGRVYASDINESIGAESVVLKDTDKKLLEVYFEPNKPEQYIYHKGSLIKK